MRVATAEQSAESVAPRRGPRTVYYKQSPGRSVAVFACRASGAHSTGASDAGGLARDSITRSSTSAASLTSSAIRSGQTQGF